MAIRHQAVAITTDASGAGTATTAAPVQGKIYEIRNNAAGFSSAGTITVTRKGYGGTVATITGTLGPFSVAPGIPVYDSAGNKSLYSTSTGGTVVREPVSDQYLTVTIGSGGNAVSGTIYVIYDGD